MRILHIAGVRYSKQLKRSIAGGISNSVPKLAEAQLKRVNSVGIITIKKSDNPLSRKIYWESAADRSFIDLMLNDPFERVINEFGLPDIIHTHDIYEIKILPFIYHAAKHNIKIYSSPRGNLSPLALSRKKLKKILYLKYFFSFFEKKIHAFVALNSGEKRNISKRYKKKKIITISNGVENNDFFLKKFRDNYKLKQNSSKIKIGFIGRYEVHIKGLDLLMEGFINYQNQTDKNLIKLILIGDHSKKTRSEKYFEEIEKKINYKQNYALKSPHFNEEKFEQLSCFDIFVHTSRTEGMPNAVLEAISMGIPCLVTPQTNMGKIIKEANCGWVINPCTDDIMNFFLSIENVSKKELYEKGQNGIKYAKKYLEWERVAAREFYE
tara:strand:+ start:31839 stop:32981 length:1143 start_codon:yes stop_codon:yes gene_type:complete